MNDNEELRKKIIDSYDSQLKDIFTEDEIEHLLSDPVFCTCEKRTAEVLKKLTETDLKTEQT